jgi:hypothetical protein
LLDEQFLFALIRREYFEENIHVVLLDWWRENGLETNWTLYITNIMLNNTTVEALPPLLLLVVLVKFVTGGGNLFELCSSSSTMSKGCDQMKDPLLRALEKRKRTETFQAMNEAEVLEIILKAFEANMLDVVDATIVDVNFQTKINSLLCQVALSGEIELLNYILPKSKSPTQVVQSVPADHWIMKVF